MLIKYKRGSSDIMKQKNSSPVQAIDLFGGKFNLSFSSTTGAFQTKLGGYLTVLLGMISMGFLINIMLQYFDTESPIVTTSTELNTRNHVFNLYDEHLYLIIAFSNAYGFIEDYKRFATPKLRVYNMVYNYTKKTHEIKIIKEFDFISCSSVTDPKMKEIVEVTHSNKDIQRMSLCPDFAGSEDEFTISDDLDTNIYRRAELTIYPCSLEDQANCAKPEEFFHFRTYYGQMNKLLTSANFEEPVTLSPTIGDINLNDKYSKLMKFAVFNNKIIDRKYEFFAPKIRKEYSSFEIIERDINPRTPGQIHCTKKQVALWKRGGCSEYLAIVYEVKREVFIVMRNYKRITDVFGQFGGIMKLLTTAVFFLYSWYNKAQIRSSIIAATFGFTPKDEKEVERFLNFIQSSQKPDGVAHGDKSNLNNLPNLGFVEKQINTQKVNQELNLNEKRRNQSKPKNNNGGRKMDQILTKMSKKDSGKNEGFKFETILSQLARQRTNVNDLISKLNFLDFLQKMFLDKNLKKLLPMLLLKAECEEQQEHQSESDEKGYFSSKKSEKAILREPEQQIEILEESSPKKRLKSEEPDEEVNSPVPIQVKPKTEIIRNSLIQKKNPAALSHQRQRNKTIWPKRLQVTPNQPTSLKSAYQALKISSQSESCPLRGSIKNYVITQIGDFFEQEKQEYHHPAKPDEENRLRIIRPRRKQRGSESTQKAGEEGEGLKALILGGKSKNKRFSTRRNKSVVGRLPAQNKNFKRVKRKNKTRVMGLESPQGQVESWQNYLD